MLNQNLSLRKEEVNVLAWLKAEGYDTTINALLHAFDKVLHQDLATFDYYYSTRLNGRTGPSIMIKNGLVSVDDVQLNKVSYVLGTVIWNESESNDSSAVIHLRLLTNFDNKPLPFGSYIGPQMSGLYWRKGQPKPIDANIFGKVGVEPADSVTGVAAAPITAWAGKYLTYLSDATGDFRENGSLTIEDAGEHGKPEIMYNGDLIRSWTYSNGTLSWSAAQDNSNSASMSFSSSPPKTTGDSSSTIRFIGKLWSTLVSPPSDANLFGQVEASENTGAASLVALKSTLERSLGINLGFSASVLEYAAAAFNAIMIFTTWLESPSSANRTAYDKAATNASGRFADMAAIEDGVTEVNFTVASLGRTDLAKRAAKLGGQPSRGLGDQFNISITMNNVNIDLNHVDITTNHIDLNHIDITTDHIDTNVNIQLLNQVDIISENQAEQAEQAEQAIG